MSFDVCPASDLITQGFGCTDYLSEWAAAWCPSKRYHSGIDLGSTTYDLFRKPVFATRSGMVVAVGGTGDVDWGFPYWLGSQAVCLQAGSAFIIYAHLDVADVQLGQSVQVGTQIGLVGSRGNSTGPHLHYEARTDGARQNVWDQASAVLDPRPYLNKLTGGTAGSEIRVQEAEMLTPQQKANWLRVTCQQLLGRQPTDQEGKDWATPVTGELLDDGSNVDACYLKIYHTEESQNYRTALEKALAGLAGPRGPKGDQGPPGTSPTHFTITGTAEAV